MTKTPRSAPVGVEESPSHPLNNMSCRHYCPICMLYFRTALESRCCGNTICEACATSLVKRSAGHSSLLHTLIEATTPQRGAKPDDAMGEVEDGAAVAPRQSMLTPVRVRSNSSRSQGAPFVRQTLLNNAQVASVVQSITPCPFCQRSLKVRVLAEQAVSKSYKDSPAIDRYSCSTADTSSATVSIVDEQQPRAPREPSNESSHSVESSDGVYSATMSTFRRGAGVRPVPTAAPHAGTIAPSPVKTGDSFEALRRKLVPLPTSTAAAVLASVTTIGLPPLHPSTNVPTATRVPLSDAGRRLPDVHAKLDAAAAAADEDSSRGRPRRTFSNFQGQPARARGPSLPAVQKSREAPPQASSWCPIM